MSTRSVGYLRGMHINWGFLSGGYSLGLIPGVILRAPNFVIDLFIFLSESHKK